MKYIYHSNDIENSNVYIWNRCLEKFSSLEEEDDFTEILMFPKINPKTTQNVSPVSPEFRNISVVDIFKRLVRRGVLIAQNSLQMQF